MDSIKKNININFQVKQGDSFNESFEFLTSTAGVETPFSLVGSSASFVVTDSLNNTVITGSTTITGSPANTVNVTMIGSSTNVYPSEYDYTLEIVGTGSPVEINSYIVGKFEIL